MIENQTSINRPPHFVAEQGGTVTYTGVGHNSPVEVVQKEHA